MAGLASSPGLTIVAYHNFAKSACAATRHLGITTDPDALERQLDFFAQNFNVVGLDELIGGGLPERALIITFDDSYRSVLKIAAPALAKRRMRSVLFANPRPITGHYVPLDNLMSLSRSSIPSHRIAEAFSRAGFAAEKLAVLMTGSVAGLTLAEMPMVEQILLRLLEIDAGSLHGSLDLFLRPEDLCALEKLGIEIGNHTTTHTRCGLLTAEQLAGEIGDAKLQLEAVIKSRVRAFAFPWGDEGDATPDALGTVRATGHEAIFLMHGRSNRWRPAADIYYRSLMLNQTGWKLRASLSINPLLRSVRSGAAFGSRGLTAPM